ncbi:hypothetical protein ES703_90940 [subsurface metagenome]
MVCAVLINSVGGKWLQKQTDFTTCPKCGATLPVRRSGRKKLNIGVKNICDALRACRDIALAAEKLGCSWAYIYQQLGKCGMRPKEVVQGK